MSTPQERTLTLVREFDAPVEKVWRGWTDPQIMALWFCPKPWTAEVVAQDLRPGGAAHMVMHGPNGEEMDNPGVYLEVIPNKRLVFTDAFTPGWVPSGQPFMVASIDFEDIGGGRSRTTARAMHWTKEAAEQHEQMGFSAGWGVAADQLNEVVKGL